MKCKIPEISWHNRDPVLSVDIQPKMTNDSTMYRLASGGTDSHVLIWYMNLNEHDISLDLAADLTRHQRAVNAVKWSPNGELLASGDDESVVFIWKQKAENEPLNIVDTTNEQDKEVWITLKVLRGHMEDIYDLCWAPNSQFLVTGSVDNSAMIWDVQKGKYTAMLTDHKGFVQGVTWDPKNQYIATLSTDRYLRIFDIQTKRVVHRINKALLPVPEGHQLHGHRMRLFHDDTLQTFFRRLCFTPDGKLLLTPAGVTDYEGVTKPLHTTYMFSRHAFKQPAIVLPCADQYTVAVRCCPLLFRLRAHNPERNPPAVPLPYRMIFAVATRSSVYFYDTQQRQPFGLISNIHYTRLTDITWSSDGRIVVVSSTDGFCSLITFEVGELGEIFEDSAAVLGVALGQDTGSAAGATKKTKLKQKENDGQSLTQTPTQNKSRKPSTDDVAVTPKPRVPMMEKVAEQAAPAMSDKVPAAATSIAIRRKNEPPKSDEVEKAEVAEPLENRPTSKDAPTPIAIRRKNEPRKNELEEKQAVEVTKKANEAPLHEQAAEQPAEKQLTEGSSSTSSAAPTPIAIRRKNEPKTSTEMAKADQPSTTEKSITNLTVPVPLPLPADIIIDKEILGSDEKFESPEKKSRPVTPISVRRQPRTPSSAILQPSTPSNAKKTVLPNQSPLSSSTAFGVNSPQQQTKRATPIAVRRTPRALIPPKPATPSVVNATTVVEEALDAWPLDVEMNDVSEVVNATDSIKSITTLKSNDDKEAVVTKEQTAIETTCDKTEDIRLVYEETVEESPLTAKADDIQTQTVATNTVESAIDSPKPKAADEQQQTQQTPGNNKTPRRVPLRTISTPKSKKKLLE